MNDYLNCPICGKKLNEGKILPCGIYCNDCSAKIFYNLKYDKFECIYCGLNHSIPELGFQSFNLISNLNNQSNAQYSFKSNEDLNERISQIEEKINEFDFKQSNSNDYIKKHCDHLRNEVAKSAENYINQINLLKDENLKKIYDFENKCYENMNDNCEEVNIFNKFMDETKNYLLNLKEYLKRPNVDINETLYTTKFLENYEIKIDQNKQRLKGIIFNEELLKFDPNHPMLNLGTIGNFRLERFRTKKFKNFSKINIFHFMLDIQRSSDKIYLQVINENILLLAYKTKNEAYKIFVTKASNSEFKVNKSIQLSPDENLISLVSFKENIFLSNSYLSENKRFYNLKKMDQNLKNLKSMSFTYKFNILSVNESFLVLFCMENWYSIYNLEFQFLRCIGQTIEPNGSFYIDKNLLRLEYRNKQFFQYNGKFLKIYDEKDGIVLKMVKVKGDDFFIRNNLDLIVFSRREKKILIFDSILNLKETIEFDYIPDDVYFLIDYLDNFIFYDKIKIYKVI